MDVIAASDLPLLRITRTTVHKSTPLLVVDLRHAPATRRLFDELAGRSSASAHVVLYHPSGSTTLLMAFSFSDTPEAAFAVTLDLVADRSFLRLVLLAGRLGIARARWWGHAKHGINVPIDAGAAMFLARLISD